ncbi:hypothetical protein A8M77_29920 [Variovorax sp. JS1663]|nr:hypothetical protein A8M77_29920 [Variovorax sp. JS1663]
MQRRADSGVWQFRIRVPADLLTVYGKADIRQSLGTANTSEAREACARLLAKVEADFAAHRRTLNPTVLHNLTPDLEGMLVERIKWRILSTDDATRFNPAKLHGFLMTMEAIAPPIRVFAPDAFPEYLMHPEVGMTPSKLERLRQIEALLAGGLSKELMFGRLDLAQSYADDETKALGFHVDWSVPTHRAALVRILRTIVATWLEAAKRSFGEPVETPPEPAAPTVVPSDTAPRKNGAMTLFDVADEWAKVGPKKQDAINKVQRALGLLKASGQSVKLHDITRHSGLAFKRYLQEPSRGFSGQTAGKHWHCVVSILRFAAHELALIDANPWNGTTAPTGTKAKREAWSVEQLGKLFASDLFTAYVLPEHKNAGADAAYWFQVIAIYSGARLHEIAGLAPGDFSVRNGVPVFEIRKSKTVAGERTVPVHAELVRLGLLDYVVARRADKASLWDLNEQPSRDGSTFFSDWHRSFRKEQGFGQPLLDFHSFRHTAISAIRGVTPAWPETAIDQCVGHESTGSEGAKRYTQHPVEKLKLVIDSITYPGLTLSRVYSAE